MSDAELDVDRLRLTSVHEAAHVIMRFALGLPVKSASIIRDTHTHTLGRVKSRREFLPEIRFDLILGLDPATETNLHSRIMSSLAGTAATHLERGWGTDVPVEYPTYKGPKHDDYQRALDYALVASNSQAEAFALVAWLRWKTLRIVAGSYFQKLMKPLAGELFERKEMSEAEIIVFLEPIGARWLDWTPKTWQGKLRLRWAKFRSRVSRAFRRIVRR